MVRCDSAIPLIAYHCIDIELVMHDMAIVIRSY